MLGACHNVFFEVQSWFTREGFQNPNGEIDLLLEYPLEFFSSNKRKRMGEGVTIADFPSVFFIFAALIFVMKHN